MNLVLCTYVYIRTKKKNSMAMYIHVATLLVINFSEAFYIRVLLFFSSGRRGVHTFPWHTALQHAGTYIHIRTCMSTTHVHMLLILLIS